MLSQRFSFVICRTRWRRRSLVRFYLTAFALSLGLSSCVQMPPPVETSSNSQERLEALKSLDGWPETFDQMDAASPEPEAYRPTSSPKPEDTLSHQPSGPVVINGVTVIRSDLLRDFLRPNLVPAGPNEMDLSEHKSQENAAAVQNVSGEIIYLVPENDVKPVVLLPGYSALNVDGFVSAVQYNLNSGKNYFKVLPGILALYRGYGEVDTENYALLKPAGDILNFFRRKGRSGWRKTIPFDSFQENLEEKGILILR